MKLKVVFGFTFDNVRLSVILELNYMTVLHCDVKLCNNLLVGVVFKAL